MKLILIIIACVITAIWTAAGERVKRHASQQRLHVLEI
jgi:hypothetical protein